MTTVIVTAKAFLLNLGTNRVTELSSGVVPDNRMAVVMARIKKSELAEKKFRSALAGMQVALKWDSDVVKAVFRCETLPMAFFDMLKESPTTSEAVYVKGKTGIDYDDKEVKQKLVYKAVLDEFQVKVVYPKTWKRAVLRTKTSTSTDPLPPQQSPPQDERSD
jgi:hypothetical protein